MSLSSASASFPSTPQSGEPRRESLDRPQRPLVPWERAVYRNRHGRGTRQATFGVRLPRYRTRSGIFDALVVAQLRRLNEAWPDLMRNLQCAVEDVPPSDPLSWENHHSILARAFPASHGIPSRIVLYRKPIERRARNRLELEFLIRDVIVERLADLTGKHPEDIDPDWGLLP